MRQITIRNSDSYLSQNRSQLHKTPDQPDREANEGQHNANQKKRLRCDQSHKLTNPGDGRRDDLSDNRQDRSNRRSSSCQKTPFL